MRDPHDVHVPHDVDVSSGVSRRLHCGKPKLFFGLTWRQRVLRCKPEAPLRDRVTEWRGDQGTRVLRCKPEAPLRGSATAPR